MIIKIKIILLVLTVFLAANFVWVSSLRAQGYSKENIYRYLKAQQSSATGLVNSFTGTSDEMLLNQAATYDEALAAMVFLLNKDFAAAARILDFFEKKWNTVGFANFYNTNDGTIGIEATIHLGPNSWVAIAALQYDAFTRTKRYQELARKIGLALAELPHGPEGGLAMGPVADWGANWREVFSAENNIDALVIFRQLEQVLSDTEEKDLFAREAGGIKRFLKEKIFTLKPRIPAGPGDQWMAADVFALSLLAFKPSELENELGLSAQEIFDLLDENFLIAADDIQGYDFTDFLTKKAFERKPMISIEWSAMAASAYLKMADYSQQLAELSGESALEEDAKKYLDKGRGILDNLDKKAMPLAHNQLVYPYATKGWEQVFPFAPWWRTPQRGEQGRLAGSLSGTCWRMFAEEKFNPFVFK